MPHRRPPPASTCSQQHGKEAGCWGRALYRQRRDGTPALPQHPEGEDAGRKQKEAVPRTEHTQATPCQWSAVRAGRLRSAKGVSRLSRHAQQGRSVRVNESVRHLVGRDRAHEQARTQRTRIPQEEGKAGLQRAPHRHGRNPVEQGQCARVGVRVAWAQCKGAAPDSRLRARHPRTAQDSRTGPAVRGTRTAQAQCA